MATRHFSTSSVNTGFLFSSFLVWIIILIADVQRASAGWGHDKVKLKDVEVLTLHHGKMTTGRRTKPVPQLQCVGGSAGCDAFVPKVVQCYNRGSDGIDVQWECKTDMDNAFRFGNVEVLCEGYDYPNDPYILKGSCGLEYTLDLTLEGMQKSRNSHGHNYYGQAKSYFQNSYIHQRTKSFRFGDILVVILVLLIIYGMYRMCLRSTQYSRTNDDYPSGPDYPYGSGFYPSAGPPPPGFRPDLFGGDASCSGNQYHQRQDRGPGFWSGAMTGGILGYLFGQNNTRADPYARTGYRERSSSPSWGETSGYSSADHSTGTRTASGFGGTRRR